MTRTALAVFALIWSAGIALADNNVGYYYPEVTSTEVFDRVVRTSDASSKAVRVDFINSITSAQLDAPESPRFVFFAKGDDAATLILTGLDDDVFSTIYRARAVMAQLTVSIRKSGFFKHEELQYLATFYDFLQLLEFDELLMTDGETWTHRVDFKR